MSYDFTDALQCLRLEYGSGKRRFCIGFLAIFVFEEMVTFSRGRKFSKHTSSEDASRNRMEKAFLNVHSTGFPCDCRKYPLRKT